MTQKMMNESIANQQASPNLSLSNIFQLLVILYFQIIINKASAKLNTILFTAQKKIQSTRLKLL